MSYSGNSSLSRDVQQRVLDTFEQTLNLAAEGSRQEALLGCDFVLRMDPQFEPARRLQDRLRASAGAIVDLDDLRPSAPPITAPPDLFASLDGLGLELPDLPPDSFAPDLRAEVQVLIAERRLQEVLALGPQHGAAIAADPALQALFQQAQELLEAEPYVKKFIGQAQAALQAGQTDEVFRLLDKARALDAGHPALAEIEDAARSRAAAAPAAPAFSAEPSFDFGATSAESAGFDLGFDSPSLDFSLDEPAASAAPAFGAPVDLFGGGGGSTDSDPRVQQLLDEGQRAFDGGDPQGAIDAWSRIFLIDIDHPEAARRIDMARRLKAESERQVEEIFHDGVGRLEAGDTEGARKIFQQVLEIQPGYVAAREYLQQIESGTLPARPGTGAGSVAASAATAADSLLPLEALPPLDDLKEEILVPPDLSEAPARGKAAPKKAGKAGGGRPRQMFVLVGSVVLLLVAGGGWYVFQNRDQFFPNSQAPGGVEAPSTDPIARAQALHDSGKTASAISQLRRLPPSDPQYQQAQALIAQWEAAAEPAPGAQPAVPATTPPPAIPAPQAALLDAAHNALAEGSRLRAVEYFEQAEKIAKLSPEETLLLQGAREALQPLSKQIDLFHQHEWDYILNDLWRMHEENPADRDVTRLIVDSYYNLGVRDLQRSDAVKAEEKFKEAIRLAPGDELLRRHQQFARTYKDRPKDLLYRIYVKYLALR
jgi:tetratricopeptide (TPR) repeat protein